MLGKSAMFLVECALLLEPKIGSQIMPKSDVLVEASFMTFWDEIERNPTRNHAHYSHHKEKSPRRGFLNTFNPNEVIEGNSDECKIDYVHVKESEKIDSRS